MFAWRVTRLWSALSGRLLRRWTRIKRVACQRLGPSVSRVTALQGIPVPQRGGGGETPE